MESEQREAKAQSLGNWMIESWPTLTWRGRAYIRFTLFYTRARPWISALAFSIAAMIFSLAAIFPGLLPWAWLPATFALCVGLAGGFYPIRRAMFWLLSRFV